MVDVFPRRNLPPLAEQWGREVENRVVSSEGSIESLQQGLSGQNRNTASSLAVIAQQVQSIQDAQADLLGRDGYSTGSSLSQTWTSTQPNNTAWGPTLSFVLNEPRTVSVQFMVNAIADVIGYDSSTGANAYLRSAIFVNGAIVSGARGDIGATVGTGGASPRMNYIRGDVSARTLLNLPAGDHSVQGGFAFRTAELWTGANGEANLTASNPYLFVDVLQRV